MSSIRLPILLGVLICASTSLADDSPSVTIAPDVQQLVSDLASDPRVIIALENIESQETRLIADLIELTEIPAPPFGEAQRGVRFAEMLRATGLADVSIDGVGNVIGRWPGRTGNKVVVYSAHLDTVFPAGTDVSVRVEGDTYFAPGIGDNTRGLVAVLGVLRAMQHANLETDADILFVGNIGEEGLGDLRGTKYLFREGGPQIDSMIAVDGGRTERVVYSGVGSHRYRVTFKGPGGHSWGAFGTANPHHALGRAIAKFVDGAPEITSTGPKTSYNIGRMGGGTSINSVPFESWMEVDMRSVEQSKLDAIDAVLQRAVQQALLEENAARLEGPELTVEVERVGTRPAAHGDINSPLMQTAAASLALFGLEIEPQTSSTDANLPISLGIPAITISRGGKSADSHSPAESWQNINAHVGLQVGLLTLLAEAGLAPSD
jgi:tripeptide aminopeptidase